MANPRTIYYLIEIFRALGMASTATIYTPFLFSIGLSIGDMAILNVGFWTIIVLSELPTGMFADGKSRAWSVKASVVFNLIGTLTYSIAFNFWSALAAELIIGIAEAFISGAMQAWVVDALGRRGEGDNMRHVFATRSALRGLAAVFGGIGGALIGMINYRFVWLLSSFYLLIAVFMAMKFMGKKGEPITRINELSAFKQSYKIMRTKSSLRWATASAVIFGLIVPFNHYWSPFFVSRIGKWGPGMVWLLLYLSVAMSGYLVRKLSIGRGKEIGFVVFSLALTGFSMAFIGVFSGISIPIVMCLFHEMGRGAYEPLLDSFTQHRIESSYRATYGSLQSLIGRIGFGATLLGVWWGTLGKPNNIATMVSVLTICGSLLFVLSFVLWIFRPKE